MFHAREVKDEPAQPAAKAPATATGRAARSTRHRSETYVARRSPALLVSGLKSLAKLLYEARWTLRVMSVTAAAAGAAWALCSPLGTVPAAFGAASAVYAVQLTVRTSVLDGAKRTVLMSLSVFLAVAILRIVGLSAVAVIALVFVSLGIGQLLRLGLSGSLQIPGTAIFILALGTSMTTVEVFDRVWATLIGAVVGAAASYVAYPGDPRARARRALAELAGSIAELLAEMSVGVQRVPTATETDLWLARSRGLEEDLEHVRPLVDEAVAFLSVDIFGRKTGSSELSQLLAALTHSVAQVRAIARTLFDHRLDGAPRLPASLAEVLSRTAHAYHARAEALQGDDPNVDAALEAVRQARRESLRSLRRVDQTGSWVVSGAILTEVDRMVQQLEGDAPALVLKPETRRRPHLGRRRNKLGERG
jgi:uncharacterized membrane protein YgaE (UPF0421/DUF939 family)